MSTPSYDKFATETVEVWRSPAPDADGKVGAQTQIATLTTLPPDTMDASAVLGFGIQNPHSAWVLYYEGSFEFKKGDKLEINGIKYQLRNMRKFPDYRHEDNTSWELVIELPEQ